MTFLGHLFTDHQFLGVIAVGVLRSLTAVYAARRKPPGRRNDPPSRYGAGL